MRLAPWLAALLVSPLLAGCAERMPEAIDLGRERGDPGAPWYKEWRADVGLDHNASYEVPVAAVPATLQLDVRLEQDPTLPAPAVLTVTLLAPDGTALARRTLDARTPEATFGPTDLPAAGVYVVHVAGQGAGALPAGTGDAARYTVAAEVVRG